jgi:hypothetical protein
MMLRAAIISLATASALRTPPGHTARGRRTACRLCAAAAPPLESLQKAVKAREEAVTPLSAAVLPDIVDYLNENAASELLMYTLKYTDIGKTAASKNMWSRGSWTPKEARVEAMELTPRLVLQLQVSVEERGKNERTELRTTLTLDDADQAFKTVDDLRSGLLRLSFKAGEPSPSSSALLRLPGASDAWSLPDDLWLNTTPYTHEVRNLFYDDIVNAMQAAVAEDGAGLFKVTASPPELNMEMDSYRVGTLLELVRLAGLGFASHGMRVRCCVQGSMGEGGFAGVPRVLSGVRKVMSIMDWQANEGELYEGVVNYSEEEDAPEGLIRFGAVGADELSPDDDVVIVIAPQSMVGASIYPSLSAMTERAAAQGTAVILINPLLNDIQSSSGIMTVRGRSERLAYAATFREIYHFRLLFTTSTFMFPILGALRMSAAAQPQGETPLFVLYQRKESGVRRSGGSERYVPVGVFDEEPTSGEITQLVPREVEPINPGDWRPMKK